MIGPLVSLLPLGAVYIYNNLESAWTLTAKLSSATPKYRDYFGHSVRVYEELMVVGADGVDSPQGSEAGKISAFSSLFITPIGAAYVYARQPSTLSWSCQYKLSVAESNSYAGKAVDLNENNIFVSKTGDSSSAGMVHSCASFHSYD